MMQVTKPLFLRILVVLLFQFIFFQTKATHVVGAEVTYRCTSTPGIFEVTLIVYRNCADAVPLCSDTCGAPCNQTMFIKGVDSGFDTASFGAFTMSLIDVRDANRNYDCPGRKNNCTNRGCVTPGTHTLGIERYEFKGFANIGPTSGIPAACCNVRLVWESCCRGSQINTIASSAGTNFYIDAVVNRCLSTSPCNSSPVFENETPIVICGGENFIFNSGCIDPDVDSLSFAFAPALAGFKAPVSYIAPWSAQLPMPYSGSPNAEFPGGIRCNPFTGDVSFTPGNSSGQNFTGIMVVEVKQWKRVNGVPVVIGITKRDIQVVVLANCAPNNPPRLVTNPPSQSNPNAPKTNWNICSGQQLCFTITGKDTDQILPLISDTTYLSWNRGLTSMRATFLPVYDHSQRKLNGPREDQYKFCWTPELSAARSTPYYFTVTAKDNRCPYPGKLTYSFSIKVDSGYVMNDTVSIIKTDSGCGRYYFTSVHKNPASNTFKRVIEISAKASAPTFSQQSVSYPYKPNLMHIFNDTGYYYIHYRAYDTLNENLGCSPYFTMLDSVHITNVNTIQSSLVITQPTCFTASKGSILVSPTNSNSQYTYAIGTSPFNTNPLFSAVSPGMYNVYVKDTTGCIKAHYNVKLDPPPALINSLMTASNWNVMRYDTIGYAIAVNPIYVPSYAWAVDGGTIVSGQGTNSIRVYWTNVARGSVKLVVSGQSCVDSIQQEVSISPMIGLPDTDFKMGLTVFPNPAKNSLTITLQILPEHRIIYLYDFQGKLILQQELKLTQQLNLQELPQGMYMLKVGDWFGKIIRE